MSTLRISDAPLLPDVDGTEKIPTGGRGDYAISIDQIKDHIFQDIGKELVGLGNVDNTSDLDKPVSTAQQAALNLKADKTYVDTNLDLKADKTNVYTRSETSLALSKKADLVNGVVPENQIPSSFNDVLEFTTPNLPIIGESGKIYVTTDTNKTWRWATNKYVEISGWNPDSVSKSVTLPTYYTKESGVDPITGVSNGAYFNVRSEDDDAVAIEYQNIGGVPTLTGKSYPSGNYVEAIAEYTALPFKTGKSYALYERVQLDSGDIVKSTIDGNTNNPNEDMTGWELEGQDLIDSSQSSFSALVVADLLEVKNPKPYQKKYVSSVGAWYTYYADTNQPENGVTVVDKWVMDTQPFYLASWFAKSDGTDQKIPIATGYAYATLKKRPFVIDGVFSLGSSTESRAGLEIISNSKLTFLPQAKFVQLPTTLGLYQLVNVFGAENYTILNPNLEGDKLTHTGTTGEWGHLLNVMDSKNGFIFKPKLKYGWGDGLYIGRKSASELDYDPTNITVFEPEIEGCRRNGLSLCSGINVQVIRPKIKRIGDYDGVTGAFPKSCIDVEPNQFAVGYSQPYIKDCIIEDAALSESYTGLYVSSHWDNVKFDIHIKGITRITSTTNNCFGFWNGGTGSVGSVIVDHIVCDGTQSFIGSPFAWGSDGNLTCEIKQLDIAENWTTFSFHNTYNGNYIAKKLGNFVIRNIKWGKNTTCRFIYTATDQPYTFEYQFFKHPSVLKEFDVFHSGVTTAAQSPTFGPLYNMEGTWTIETNYSFSKLKPNTIVQLQPDATIRYVSMQGDYAKRTIRMSALVANPEFGVYINGISVVMGGATYTRLISKTRGASVTVQNVQGGNTLVSNMVGEWQFAS